jgi:hypothetical protein
MALASLARLAVRSSHRQARHSDGLAPARLASVLALEEPRRSGRPSESADEPYKNKEFNLPVGF